MSGRLVRHGLAVVMILGLACARQGFPPGGPEDKTPPEIISATPVEGATGIALESPVTIRFNEWMEKRSVVESIFISPVPKQEPNITVKPEVVTIEFAGGLSPDQTYVITIGTGAKDAHGNRLASSWSLAFSTGERIDRGSISGRVYWPEGDVAGAFAWAYRLDSLANPDPAFDRAEYVTQADASGSYGLSFLSPGRYRLFAFADTDNNGACTMERDPLGLPAQDILLRPGADGIENRLLMLAVRDTTRPECLSVTAVDRLHADLRMNEAIDLVLLGAISIVEEGGDAEGTSELRAAYLDPQDRRLCHLLTSPQREGATYQVSLCEVADEAGNRVHPSSCRISFSGSAVPDTAAPLVVATSPVDSARAVPFDSNIEYFFSEALDTAGAAGALSLTTAAGDTIRGRITWPTMATLRFLPEGKLKGATTYLARLEAGSVRDAAGNSLRDTLRSFAFTTVEPDTLGQLSGSVADSADDASGQLIVMAQQVQDRRMTYSTAVQQPGPYLLGDLLPGRYVVWAFRDMDGNGRFSPGRLRPLEFSEPFTWGSDTLEVRSRWETQGVDLVIPER